MYFDSLTIVSLIIFAVAFGSFVYACIIRSCITDSNITARDERSNPGNDGQARNDGE